MITDENNLRGTLHQFTSFSDTLYALFLHAEQTGDWELFPLHAKGLFHHVRELSVEIQEWMQSQPQEKSGQEEQAETKEEVAAAA